MLCPRCSRTIPDDAVFCCYCGRTIVKKSARTRQRPNGTGTVYKRRGASSWTASVTLSWTAGKDGKRRRNRRTKTGFKTKADALRYLESLREQEEKRLAPPLTDYWELYSNGKMEKLSDSKQTAYRIAWKKMKDLAPRRVDHLSVADLAACVEDNASTYYPAHDMKVLFRHLFRLAAADGWVRRDLPDYIDLPEKNETEREPFTEAEQAALWRAYDAGDADAAIPLVMIYTGLMTGELRRLETGMIDFSSSEIRGVGLKTKVRRSSSAFFPDEIAPILEELCARAVAAHAGTASVPSLSVSASGSAPSVLLLDCSEDEFYARYYAALERAGCRRLTPYSCRHTTATRLAVTQSIAPQTIKKIMRWSTTKMLDRYAHPDNADAVAAINTIGKPAVPGSAAVDAASREPSIHGSAISGSADPDAAAPESPSRA